MTIFGSLYMYLDQTSSRGLGMWNGKIVHCISTLFLSRRIFSLPTSPVYDSTWHEFATNFFQKTEILEVIFGSHCSTDHFFVDLIPPPPLLWHAYPPLFMVVSPQLSAFVQRTLFNDSIKFENSKHLKIIVLHHTQIFFEFSNLVLYFQRIIRMSLFSYCL